MSDNIDDEDENKARAKIKAAINYGKGRPRKDDSELAGPRMTRRLPDNTYEFELSKKKIPERLHRIMEAMLDTRNRPHASVLTLEDIEKIPDVRDLPKPEKALLMKYWPHFWQSVEHVKAVSKLRSVESAMVTDAHKTAAVFRDKFNLDNLPLSEQLQQVSHIYDKQIYNAALVLGATSVEKLHTDPLSLALYRLRVNYIKDFAWVRDKIHSLGRQLGQDVVELDQNQSAESATYELLETAKKKLRDAGYDSE